MATVETALALVLLATVLLLLWTLIKRPSLPAGFPPGPRGLPLLGYLPFLGHEPYQTLFRLRDKYGPVISLQLGTKLVVVLNRLDVIKEALGKPAFLGRPTPMPFQIDTEKIGFVDQSGTEWREQRQFSFRVLQSLGFGTVRMEDYVKEEVQDMIDHLRGREGRTLDIVEVINPSVSNVINSLTFGRRFELGDPKRKLLDDIVAKLCPCFRQVAGVYFLPVLAQKLFKYFSPIYKEGRKYSALQQQLLKEEILNHRLMLEENNPRDYIDMYLLEMRKSSKGKTNFFHEGNLMGNLRLLSAAGSDTVLASLEWAFIIVAAYPPIQDRIQEEVDSVIGRNRTPSYADQALMPYTQAAILEIHRWKTNLPLNVLRRTTSACSVGGFHLPSDTTVIANLWAVHNDPDLWHRPQDFRPDRFLDAAGRLDTSKSDMIASFTFGPRSCPGKALANLEVFLFFVSVLQHFRLSTPEGVQPSLEGELQISYKPLQTKMVFSKR